MIAIMRAHILAFAAVLGLGLAIVTSIAIAPPALAQEATPATQLATIGPVVPKAQSGPCVRDSHEFMRRNHMWLLKHQRDETMHKGMRGKSADSLKKCISCHAVKNGLSTHIDPYRPETGQAVAESLTEAGYDVVVSIGEVEENEIGSNCGQYVLKYMKSEMSLKDGYTYEVKQLVS